MAKQDYSWYYLAAAAAGLYFYTRNKSAAAVIPAPDPNAQPVGLVANDPTSGLPILSSPTAPIVPPATGTSAPLAPGVSWTPWGSVAPSVFGPGAPVTPPAGDTSGTVVTPPTSVGPLAVSLEPGSGAFNAEGWAQFTVTLKSAGLPENGWSATWTIDPAPLPATLAPIGLQGNQARFGLRRDDMQTRKVTVSIYDHLNMKSLGTYSINVRLNNGILQAV